MSKHFVISDTHFHHRNIIEYQKRSFKSVNAMDEFMIDEWNRTVSKSDIVYHLGDVGMFNNPQQLIDLMCKLNGKIFLVMGNHDYKICRKLQRFKWIKNKFFIGDMIVEKKVKFGNVFKKVMMSHYPISSWSNGSRSFHFHGHIHSNGYAKQVSKFSYNVCVDSIGYKPMLFEEVVELYEAISREFF